MSTSVRKIPRNGIAESKFVYIFTDTAKYLCGDTPTHNMRTRQFPHTCASACFDGL